MSLLASMLATRTFRPSVVVLIWSAAALTTFLISSCTALCAFPAFLNAFPPLSRVDLRAALPSVLAGFVAVCASTLTSGFPILTAPLLAVPIDPVAPR